MSLSVHGTVHPFASLTVAACGRARPFSLARAAPYCTGPVTIIAELADADPSAAAGSSTSTTLPPPASEQHAAPTGIPSAASSSTGSSTGVGEPALPRFPAARRGTTTTTSGRAEAPIRVAPGVQPPQAVPPSAGDAQAGSEATSVGSEQEEAEGGPPAGSPEGPPEEEAGTATDERELATMPARCWCAACKKDLPHEAVASGKGALTCGGCHRCYHPGCAASRGLGTGWAARLPAWALQLPPFVGRPWFHCDHCRQVAEALQQFAEAGEVEMPGIRNAMLDADTEEEVPYYTLQLFRAQRQPALAEEAGFRQLVGVLRRHAPLYVPLVTPLDCLEFDYGLLVRRDSKPVAAAMFDVFGREVAASPLYGARDTEARECLVELWAEVLRDCGLQRVGLQLPDDDDDQKELWWRGHGFQTMDKDLLDSLSKEIPAYAEELQVGTCYLVRDLFSSPEILRSPEDVRARFVELALNDDVVDKVGQRDVGVPRKRGRGA